MNRPVRIWRSFALAVAAAAFLTACASHDAPPANASAPVPTAGQQLIDLKRAYDMGVLSNEEYARQRTAILGKKSASAQLLVPGSALNETIRGALFDPRP